MSKENKLGNTFPINTNSHCIGSESVFVSFLNVKFMLISSDNTGVSFPFSETISMLLKTRVLMFSSITTFVCP